MVPVGGIRWLGVVSGCVLGQDVRDKNPLGFDGRSFDERSRRTRLVEKDDVHGPATTIQGRCALATDTPPPMVIVILRRDNQPLGHPSCKQSKNSQEQENKY
jgi:hypothetical protein